MDQQALEELLRRRIRSAGHELSANTDLATFEAGLQRDGPEACVVLQDFDLETFLSGTLQFLGGLDPGARQSWYRSFTRTSFLSGRPRKLTQVLTWDHLSADGSIGWILLRDDKEKLRLKRLLKRLKTASAIELPEGFSLTTEPPDSSPGGTVEIDLLVRQRRLEETLIDLNHLLCEAVIDGMLRPGDTLRLYHREGPARSQPPDGVRIGRDREDPTRLKAHAFLYRLTPEASPRQDERR